MVMFAWISRRLGITGALPAWIIVLLYCVAAGGCTTPQRFPAVPLTLTGEADLGSYRYRVARDATGFVEEARSSLQKEMAWRSSTGVSGSLPPANYLAISGGGDDGAFGSGILAGWSAAGTRPEFKVVTGVSTGALIAPFAFLGPRYDGQLRKLYTGVSRGDIYRPRNIISAFFFGDALADTAPLSGLMAQIVDRQMLDAIAAEYAKGRLLLVGTTNLDTLEPVIWNMTAIAASHEPGSLELFHDILLASAAIPAVFPPVMIDIDVHGTHYQEMHVDGGAVSQVFLYPPMLRVGEEAAALGADRERHVYIIRNARLDPDWASVKRRTMPIAARAVASLMHTQGIGDLYRIFSAAQRDGIDYNLTYIPRTFDAPHDGDFDPAYMRPLFDLGYEMGLKGVVWQKHPPGYSPSTPEG
jgi:predicted acylesterase/phospholipase RssA